MSANYEHLKYNRRGERYVTAKELREQRKRVLSHNLIAVGEDQKSQNGSGIEWVAWILGQTISKQRIRG